MKRQYIAMSIATTIKNFDRRWQRVIIFLTFPFLITLFVGLFLAGYFMNRMNNGLVLLAETDHLILISRQNQKEFLLYKNIDAVDKFSDAYAHAQDALAKLKGMPGLSDDANLDSLESSLARFRSTFLKIVDHQKLIGLDENSGLRGEFRRSIQDVEDIFRASGNDTLFGQMLMCRRNEKDFLIRNKRKDVDRFQLNLALLLDQVDDAGFTPAEQSRIRVLLELYSQGFHGLVAAMHTIGLNSEIGLLGQMKQETKNLEALLDTFQSTLQAQRGRIYHYLMLLGVPLLLLMVHTTILLLKFMRTNERMVTESETRRNAQNELKQSHEELEQRVNERTAALTRSVQELELHNREIALLGEMNDHLQVCQEQAETFPIVSRYSDKLLPGTTGCLYLYKASRVYLEQVASWGDNLNSEPIFNPEDCWALRMGKTHHMSIDDQSVDCHHRTTSDSTSYICEPLTAQGEVVGLLHVQFESKSNVAASSNQIALHTPLARMIATMAENMAMALTNLNLREVLRVQSIRDPLTGLFNRRYMEETFERELGRVKRGQTGLTVLMLDVDHFKKYNDTFGHHAGDTVLAQIGEYLTKCVRTEDIPCRYGGEEFILIMPGLPADGALRRAETIRKGISEMSIEHKGQPLNTITISMGVASFPNHGESAREIIQAADQALYRAKRNGRNRAFMASNPRKTSHDAA